MITRDALLVDTRKWPQSASLTEWSRVMKISYGTLMKKRGQGKLPGMRMLSGQLRVDKQTMMKAFGISND